MQNAKEQLLAKINEVYDLLGQAKCDGLALFDTECEAASEEIYTALSTFEQAVDYYVD